MLRNAITLIGAAALLLMMLYTVLNVIIRATVGAPLPAAIELTTRWWMIPLVFSGWVLAHLVREHIIVDFVVDGAGRRVRIIMAVVNGVLLALFLGLVAYAGVQGALENQARGEYGIDTGWPVWATRYVIPVFAVVFIGYLLHDAWRWIAGRRGETVGVHEAADTHEAVETDGASETGEIRETHDAHQTGFGHDS